MKVRSAIGVALLLLVAVACTDDDARGGSAVSPTTERAAATPTTAESMRSGATGGAAVTTTTAAPAPPSTRPSKAGPVTTVLRPDDDTPPATVETSPATTVPPVATTAPASAPPPTTAGESVDRITLGQSVQGRAIEVIRRGTPGGVAILVVGVIHGDEDDGSKIIDALREMAVPEGIELWLVPSMNPDGQAAGVRQNANGVDLNRNFPTNWGPVAGPGDWQYAGAGPASEPEVQAMVALSEQVRPSLTLWYHQDLFRINPAAGRDGELRVRYAELTGLPIIAVTGGTYTGTASQWSRTIAADAGIGFTVELGPTLDRAGALQHAEAVLAVAAEL